MKRLNGLEKIGFYTLNDDRANGVTDKTSLQRCEIILTDRCNFKCPYCRGPKNGYKGDMEMSDVMKTLELWVADGLKNIRFSGGEPTLHEGLEDCVKFCKEHGVERVAVSTNGSAPFEQYKRLIECGVNDFSISLDACCASIGNSMAGVSGKWNEVVENIKLLSGLTYVTVGMVFTEGNINDCVESIMFVDSLGVSDIRIIPSAQYNRALNMLSGLPKEILDKYPILNYRIKDINKGMHVRGISNCDCNKCPLVLDDMIVSGEYHFPCVIYMREYGDPIGKVNSNMRQERLEWMRNHNTKKDKICSKNCLDICVQYNNTACQNNSFVKVLFRKESE